MKMKRTVFLFIMLVVILAACGPKEISLEHTIVQHEQEDETETNNVEKETTNNVAKESEEAPVMNEAQREAEQTPKKEETEITIAAIGDVLLHDTVYKDAKTDDGYDFMPMSELVKPYLKESTITFANQETMIGGEEIGLSSYPQFNSPTEIGDALKESGVDIVSLANNHTLDRGEEAIQNALAHWDQINMPYVGAYKDKKDAEKLRVVETEEGIDVAFLAYTYGTNGIPVPKGKDYLVNLIDKDNIAADIKQAKSEADVTIISLHFGDEYNRLPNDAQKDLVQFVADLEVDAVLGHHPHVLQPTEWIEGKNGNETLVIYSLGNFLSGQDELHRLIGGMFRFTVKKIVEGDDVSIELHTPQFLPTYNFYENWRNFKVIPMHELTDKQLKDAQKHYKEIEEHMSQWMPELEFVQ
ncbi:CapA family protein [Pseudogracilibacillus sp. ICA-222130]|uniref:CapA family protein n=1 Tax=Pseudogracilibacillus sp. ICA-222130 TaxID=3134655 RepID=UPI0030BFC5A1